MHGAAIRRATRDDATAIVALLAEMHATHLAWDAARWTTADPPHASYAAWIAELIGRPTTGAVFVAEANGAVVGYALAEVEAESTRHWSPRAVYLHDLFVTAAYRRRGIADALLAAMIAWAHVGHPRLQLRLMTAAPNEAARAFFARRGFRACVVEMIRDAGT